MLENKRIKKAINLLISQGKISSQKEIGEKLGITNKSYLSQLVNAENPSEDFVNKFTELFPELNKIWLLTGEGEMIKRQEDKKEVVKSEKFVPDEFVKVRSIDISPTASFTEFEQIPPQDYDYTYIMREPGEEISGDDIVFTIHGDSMEKQIFDHDKVLGKFIRKSQWHWAKGIVIMAYDDSFVIKRILDNRLDQDNYILLGSDNPSFPQKVKVPLSSIRVMFKADRVVSRPLR